MKRFMLFIAMVGFVATSCSKTIVKDEVETAISFSAETGKLTRAIVQDRKYLTTQPFGVFAYSHQLNDRGEVITANTTKVMDTVQVAHTGTEWKSKVGSYYWPNDPNTSLDFYAYSPAINAVNLGVVNHQKMTVTQNSLGQADNGALSFEGYTHSNMYVDFMVATPVKGAKYSTPNGNQNVPSVTPGQVPLSFHHQMTQVIFNVTTDEAYNGITFQIQKITLKGINKTASYVQNYADAYGTWTVANPAEYAEYVIFPAKVADGGVAADETPKDLTNAANARTLTTTGVTMIPQEILDNTQKFEIVYKISGTGVATETVTKEVEFFVDANTTVDWEPNKKITYTVRIGLNEITFAPSVVTWDGSTPGSEYTFQQ
jgi:hypothetical protein